MSTRPNLGPLTSTDWSVRVDQIGKRKAELAHAVEAFKVAAVASAAAAFSTLNGEGACDGASPLPALVSPAAGLDELAETLSAQAKTFSEAQETAQRRALTAELQQLEDKKILSKAREVIVRRRDLLKQAALLNGAHLRISLARRTDQTKAAFHTETGTALTKLSSDILSEGEQRAVAFAA